MLASIHPNWESKSSADIHGDAIAPAHRQILGRFRIARSLHVDLCATRIEIATSNSPNDRRLKPCTASDSMPRQRDGDETQGTARRTSAARAGGARVAWAESEFTRHARAGNLWQGDAARYRSAACRGWTRAGSQRENLPIEQ